MTGWSDPTTVRFTLAVLAATVAGLDGWRRGALSADGAVAAWLVGVATVGFGGWWWGVVVVAFFLSSSVLSALPPVPDAPSPDPSTSRGDLRPDRAAGSPGRGDPVRTWQQVLANGGVPTAIAVLAGTALTWVPDGMASPIPSSMGSPAAPGVAFAAFAGALAAATADTWATEIGGRSRVRPRRLGFGPPVPPGVSGGMTILGTGAAVAGASVLAAVTTLASLAQGGAGSDLSLLRLLIAVSAGGVTGALVDNLLGGTVQGAYAAGDGTEVPDDLIRLGHRGHLVRGWPWVTNDAVNLAATITGAVVAATLAWR